MRKEQRRACSARYTALTGRYGHRAEYDEFVNYEYERNKDGDIISGYPDADNHLIDATRYALERISRRMGVIA